MGPKKQEPNRRIKVGSRLGLLLTYWPHYRTAIMPALSCVLTRIVVVSLPSIGCFCFAYAAGAEDKNLTPLGPGGYPAFKLSSSALAFSFRLVRFLFARSLISLLLFRRPGEIRLSGSSWTASRSPFFSVFQRLACLQFHGAKPAGNRSRGPNFLARRDRPRKTKPEPASLKARSGL